LVAEKGDRFIFNPPFSIFLNVVPPYYLGVFSSMKEGFQQLLIKNKRPPRSEPWWPSFCVLNSFLNISINKKPFFVSEVVICENCTVRWLA
jgi:hypothetical protein